MLGVPEADQALMLEWTNLAVSADDVITKEYPHFCLGANLARREMTVVFDEIRRRTPDLAITGEPERVLSMAFNSVRCFSVQFSD